MSKLFSKEPVSVESFESLDQVRKDYYEKQWIQIRCSSCNSLQKYRLTKPIYLDFYKRKALLCINCKKVQTSLERYGVESPNKLESVKKKQKENKDYVAAAKSISKGKLAMSPEKKAAWLEHFKATSRKHFGTDFPVQSSEMKQKLSSLFKQQTLEQKLHRATSRRRYIYENETFDSSWELALWIYAKDHNERIKRTPISFSYEFKSKTHYYFPDFSYRDQLIEVKGEYFFDEKENLICPWNRNLDEAYKAKQNCMLQNNVIVWKDKDIKFALDYVELNYGKNYLKKFKRTAQCKGKASFVTGSNERFV